MSDPTSKNPNLPPPVSAISNPSKKQKTQNPNIQPHISAETQEFANKINSARKDGTKTFVELVQLACVERRLAYNMGCIEVADAEAD